MEWIKFPDDMHNELDALKWMNKYDNVLYRGLNSREFDITEFDSNLTIQFKNQPRRFHANELLFQ